jgi:hypothetical protein
MSFTHKINQINEYVILKCILEKRGLQEYFLNAQISNQGDGYASTIIYSFLVARNL